MNANELADKLMSSLTMEYDCDEYMEQAATMLRQQQAEIERLKGSKPITYGMLTFCKNCGEQNPYQSKTLTDEEIEMNKKYSDEWWKGVELFNSSFPRSMFKKKASEK